MKINNKLKFNILAIITFIFLLYFVLKDNLLTSNISRIANMNSTNFFLFIVLSILFGILMYKSLRKVAYINLAYFGILSLFIGGIVPYDYQDVGSFNSNIHLVLALLSIIITLVMELLIINRFKLVNIKLGNLMFNGLILIGLVTIYLYSKYNFMNSLNELIYLSYLIISQTIIYNILN